jgi:inosose dehydratase
MLLDKKKISLGIASIGWTNDDLPDLGSENSFEQCISEMALAGFSGSEVGNKYPEDPEVLKKALALRGLKICNRWFSSYLTTRPYMEVEKAFIKHLDFLESMGASVIGPSEQGHSVQGKLETPVISGKPSFTDEEWEKLIKGLNRLGEIAGKRGIKLAYHHHMGTGCQTKEECEKLLSSTDPEQVFLLFDTGHFAFAGEDPVEALRKFKDRVAHVHLKDVRADVLEQVKKEDLSFLAAVRRGVFTVPGDGFIDFPSIFSILEDTGYKGWLVVEAEQEPAMADPLEYALMARRYIKKTAGL